VKPAPFAYKKARTLEEAIALLGEHKEARLLAGGQSLIATLNMRLSAPSLLIDINEIGGLGGTAHKNGKIEIGALVRHAQAERSELIAKHVPLIARALPHIGHPAIRNRGTLGGSLAYADPAAELPACAVALNATLVLAGASGERKVKAEDFFKGLFETDLRPGELIAAVEFPAVPAGTVTGFAELSRRHGDFALAGVAAVATMQSGRISETRLVYIGCADRPKVAKAVSQAVATLRPPFGDIGAIEQAVKRDLSPEDTPGLRGDTRVHLATVLTRRVLKDMSERVAA
jgi:carbon-monoxide dehydrogenase medium subunit